MNASELRRGPTRRLFLGALGAVTLTGAGAVWLWRQEGQTAAQISVGDARAMAARGEIVLIDIRRPDEWARTGIPEHGLPIDMRRPDFVDAVLTASQGKPVAVICAGGVRSRRVARAFRDANLMELIDVPEGMMGSSAGPGWLKAGLPTMAFSLE